MTNKNIAPEPPCAEPDTPAGSFTIEQPEGWERLVFDKAALSEMPPEGEHGATIHAVRLIDKGHTLWLRVEYRLDAYFEAPEPDFEAIAVRPGSPHEDRVPGGARLLDRLAAATGVNLAGHPDPFGFPELFEGKKVRLCLAHKAKDGLPALIVRRVSPGA